MQHIAYVHCPSFLPLSPSPTPPSDVFAYLVGELRQAQLERPVALLSPDRVQLELATKHEDENGQSAVYDSLPLMERLLFTGWTHVSRRLGSRGDEKNA